MHMTVGLIGIITGGQKLGWLCIAILSLCAGGYLVLDEIVPRSLPVLGKV